MIVKDEERFIGQCLDSVKSLVDEMVVVDTGSSDRTRDIALDCGARVYEHPWENNFSLHKNQAIGYATGDWILILDADEMLKPGSGAVLRKTIQQCKEEAVMVTIISYFNNQSSRSRESKIRLFQNRPGIRYEGIVHEQLIGYRSHRVCPIELLHYGYDLDRAALKEKTERTLRLVKRQIREEPDSYWHHHNLAVTYATDFRFKEAVDTAETALALARKKTRHPQNLLWTYYVLSSSAFKLNDLETAERYALEAVDLSQDHLDAHFVLALVYHAQKKWDRLEAAAQRYMSTLNRLHRSPELFPHIMLHSANEVWRVRLALAERYLFRGDKDRADAMFREALSCSPDCGQCYRLMGNIHREYGNLSLAETHYEKAWNAGDRGVDYLMSMAKLQEKKKDSAAYGHTIEKIRQAAANRVDILSELGIADLTARRYPEAIAIFEKIIDIAGPDHDALINLALACKYAGRIDEAIHYNQKALELNPGSLHAAANLGHLYYEKNENQAALETYQKAIEADPTLVDVALRLASLYLETGGVDACIPLCDLMLKRLGLPRNIVLEGVQDLAMVFLLISSGLEKEGKTRLAKEAIQVAVRIYPQIMDEWKQNPEKFEETILAMTT